MPAKKSINSRASSEPDLETESSVVTLPQEGLKIFNAVVEFITTKRMELLNITERIQSMLSTGPVCNGIVHVQSLHTTTALFINEWQEALVEDMKEQLNQMVSQQGAWRHNDPQYSDCDRQNADSHLRGMIMGQSLSVQVRDSALVLGTWQRIFYAEFDGQRSKRVIVKVLGISD